MKKLIVLMTFVLAGCTPYKTFVNVVPAPAPYGSTEILAAGSMEDVKAVLKKNSIMYKEAEGGLETEEILIDEGTRAMYKVYSQEGALKFVPYWGITSKVKSTMTAFVGYQAASAYSNSDWDRAIYEKGMNGKMSRPGLVFAYGLQLAKEVDPKARAK